jgi:uncharacterized protein (DUF1778 family)
MDQHNQHSTIPFSSESCVLNARESEAFVKALLDPAEPNEAMQAAAARYQQFMARSYAHLVSHSA